MSMFDAETTAILRSIHEEICENVAQSETAIRTRVAATILEAAKGEWSIEDLKEAGRRALVTAPTMWR
jgi:hypothetical protein